MPMQPHEKWDICLKASAVVWGVLFFGYKLAAGSLAAATSLSLAAQPVPCGDKSCVLVTITLERGENWGTYVEHAQLTVVADEKRGEPIPIQFKYPGRETFELSPGEKTQYGAIVELPAGKRFLIEALFVMQQKRLWSDPAYVFGSVAVLPKT